MPQNPRLQVPISEKNKKALEKKAKAEGFSSANDLVRLLIHRFLIDDFKIQIVQNSPQNPLVDIETEKRIYQSMQEIEQGNYDLLDFSKNPNAFIESLEE